MSRDTHSFVAAWSICAQPPFVTHHCGLLPSEGNTTILTIVDHFSKALHFVLLPKIPSALEIANLLVLHVFQVHGIRQVIFFGLRSPDIVSNLESLLPCSGRKSQSHLGPRSNGQTEQANQDLDCALARIRTQVHHLLSYRYAPIHCVSGLPTSPFPHSGRISCCAIHPSPPSLAPVCPGCTAALTRSTSHNQNITDLLHSPIQS